MIARRRQGPAAATVLIVLLLVAVGCQSTPTLVPLTSALRDDYGISDEELRGLQFYISEQLVLEHRHPRGDAEVERGRLITRDGHSLWQIVVEARTPGVVVRGATVGDTPRGHTIAVSFERGGSLDFVLRRNSGRWALAGLRSGGLLDDLFESFGLDRKSLKVRYGDSEWQVAGGRTAHLLVEQRQIGKLVASRRTLPGMRVGK